MIFELGEGSVNCTCQCGIEHLNVQVNEEIVLCRCGVTFHFSKDENGVVAPEIALPEVVRRWREHAINNDNRNLC